MKNNYKLLLNSWNEKHFQHFIYCLEHNNDYYEGSFTFQGRNKNNNLLIDDKVVTQDEVIKILATYYEDNACDYQTPLGDFLYLSFTDLATDDVDIFTILDEHS